MNIKFYALKACCIFLFIANIVLAPTNAQAKDIATLKLIGPENTTLGSIITIRATLDTATTGAEYRFTEASQNNEVTLTLQSNSVPVMKLTQLDANNQEAIYVDSTETTAGQALLSLESSVTTANQVKFHINSDGATYVSLTGTQNTVALCHSNNGQTINDQIVDCSGAPSDVAEYFGSTDSTLGAAEVVMSAEPATEMYLENYHTGKAWVARANTAYSGKIIGVISTAPSVAYGDEIFTPEEHHTL